MPQKATLKTISADLDISVGTVSRILNGKAKQFRISDKTIELVLAHAKKVGYSPNLLAKSLRDSKTYTLGLVIPDIANPFFASLAKNIDKAATEANYSILFVNSEENINKEKQQVQNLLSRKVDGIIAAPVGTSFSHYISIKTHNIPLVFIDRFASELDIPYVSSDNHQGGYEATKLFLKQGHKKIALIKGNEDTETVIQRRKGYEHALLEESIKPNPNFIIGTEFSTTNGFQCTKELFKQKDPPTAIFAMSNLIGLGVLQALNKLKRNIPEDVSLIVFDDQPYLSYLKPAITTVRQNLGKIGSLAVENILKLVENKDQTIDSIIIPTKVIERESVKNITPKKSRFF